ncbi:hypothetical protein EGR_09186 [Echinococcus granulosus]|uniref:Uncharacterized protein n=1 Tax=Echinococcus granulosus TaxID=6210 RepID=W6URF2_ECHGR|nr:hypothetical protein EGR_09186 [Echinococcus granulosus]EUB55939.1 hypothetical protein EGR_09186 [Echinococcus granulosus]
MCVVFPTQSLRQGFSSKELDRGTRILAERKAFRSPLSGCGDSTPSPPHISHPCEPSGEASNI